jgi:hypothetical protein
MVMAMKKKLGLMTVAVGVSFTVVAGMQNQATPQEQAAAVPPAAPAGTGLSDLEALTRSCSTAALNAAARRAAAAPSQGKYQFSYFNLISDSHHGQYEVHFTSNYEGEPVLKYCVEIYCQQGWDPRNAKATITEIGRPPQRGTKAPHRAGCGQIHTPSKARTKR